MASDRIWGNTNTRLVIVDTSAFMMIFEFLLDIEDELTRLIGKHHILVPTAVIKELDLLLENKSETKRKKAKMALKYLDKKNYDKIISKEGDNADKSILNLAKEKKTYVLTNDRPLIRELKKNGIKVISLRSKKKLFIE